MEYVIRKKKMANTIQIHTFNDLDEVFFQTTHQHGEKWN